MLRKRQTQGFAIPLALIAALVAGHGEAATDQSPSRVIEKFHGALLATMKQSGTLDVGGRYLQLAGPVSDSYDLAAMTRISCGGYWRKASEAEKQDLVKAFSRISIGTYAVRFDGYSGQSFEILGVSEGPRGTKVVKSSILGTDRGPIEITYVLRSSDLGWRIVDVLLAGGISELALRRSEYRSFLKSSGVRGLIEVLNKKADRMVGLVGQIN